MDKNLLTATIFILISTIPFLFLFLFLFIVSINSFLRNRSSQSWPSIAGKITKSSIAHRVKKGRDKYEIDIEYSYNLNGVEYFNTVISYSGITQLRTQQATEEFMFPFKEGKSVPVFFNPKKPQQSCLIKGETQNLTILFFISTFMIIALAIVWLIYLPPLLMFVFRS